MKTVGNCRRPGRDSKLRRISQGSKQRKFTCSIQRSAWEYSVNPGGFLPRSLGIYQYLVSLRFVLILFSHLYSVSQWVSSFNFFTCYTRLKSTVVSAGVSSGEYVRQQSVSYTLLSYRLNIHCFMMQSFSPQLKPYDIFPSWFTLRVFQSMWVVSENVNDSTPHKILSYIYCYEVGNIHGKRTPSGHMWAACSE
jgi:hypothetical protein